jgi:hypothetical protein
MVSQEILVLLEYQERMAQMELLAHRVVVVALV